MATEKRTDVLSPRMLHIIEGLLDDWHRLDARIEALSNEIGALACKDPACSKVEPEAPSPFLAGFGQYWA
jgi:hypothetical protein